MAFPDKEYLKNLIGHLDKKVRQSNKPEDILLMLSGASLNWIADFILDENVSWEKREIPVANLYLTGTNPEWNKVIIDKAERSPENLRKLIAAEGSVKKMFADMAFDANPILVRFEEGRYKVLDGMHRAIAATRENRESIVAYIGTLSGSPQPMCEPHVVYDFIKAYQKTGYKDRESLIAALRFLKNNYVNVEGLLRNRFNSDWVTDDKVQEAIKKVLE